MRQTSSACSIVILLFISFISPIAVNATDSTIATDITWSGQHIIDGNITISSGVILTIETGTTIDCGDDFWIQIDGVMVAEGAYFFSSTPPVTQGSHGAGLWKGLHISHGGVAFLNNTLIENAKTGVKVEGELNAIDLEINHSYIGINNIGHSNINGYSSFQIDYDSIQNSGNLELSNATIQQSAVGVHSSGITKVSKSEFSSVGVALNSVAGELNAHDIEFNTVAVGLTSGNAAKTQLNEASGQNIALFIDAGNSDDLQVSSAELSGDRILVANSASMYSISNINFTSDINQNRPVIDQHCIGSCTLSNITISDANNGIFLSGHGTHNLDLITISAINSAIEATGNGQLIGNNLSISAKNSGLTMRGPSSIITGENTIHMMEAQSIGADISDSHHTWSNISFHKSYSQQDTTSLAFNSWYATIGFDNIIIENFSTGIYSEDSLLTGDKLEVYGGIDTAIELEQSNLITGLLHTKYQAFGIQMHEQSYLQSNEWIAELHNTPLKLFNQSQANIRSFVPQNTNPGSFDASGEGTILYGGSTSISVSTTESGYFEETNVAFTDISGNPVQATINANGFQIVCGQNGLAILPLLSQGSSIEAILTGTGVTQVLYGGQSNQAVQIPVIPQGNWTISDGQSVLLGPRPDGQPHHISGNLVIQSNGILEVFSTEVIVDPSYEISLYDTSQVIGSDAIVSATRMNLYSNSKVTSSKSTGNLLIDTIVNWSCNSMKSIESVSFNKTIQLHSNCRVEMLGGEILSDTIVNSMASFTQLSALQLTVIDKGEPVQGALISVNGTNELSDQYGEVSTNAIARYIDESSDSFGGIQNIALQIDSFMDFITWDSSKSFTHTFMASSVSSGLLSQSIVLEAQWSPYYLENDLIIPQLKSLTIDDGVSFRISEGTSITVHGTLDAGTSTLSSTGLGARWSGLKLGDFASSTIMLSNTDVIEASIPLYIASTGLVYGDGISLMRSTATEPLLFIESGSSAIVEIKNSQFSDGGSGCIELYQSEVELLLSNIDLSNCNGPGIWARQMTIQASNITIGEGVETGFDLTEVSGSISSIDATKFTGSGNVIWLDSMDQQFTLDSLLATTGQSAAIGGINNRNLNIDSIEITGAPAIDFDSSAGILSNIKLNGQGSGNGIISHHGRSSQSMIIENLDLQNYSVGVDLHADLGDTSAPFIIRDSSINSSTTISAENYSIRLETSILSGQSEISDSAIIEFIDVTFLAISPISLWNGAQAIQYHTLTLDAQLSGIPQSTKFEIIKTNSDGSINSDVISGTTIRYQLPVYHQVDGQLDIELSNLEVIATVSGLPIQSIQLSDSNNWGIESSIIISLMPNLPPIVSINTPSSEQEIMQQKVFLANASVSDDLDNISDLTYYWTIFDGQNKQISQSITNSPVQNLTVPNPGIYVLQLEVIDLLGASTLVSTSFESMPLDSDGDYVGDCNQDTWFDLKIGRSCGPDIYDSDDDNDGFDDIRDAWPLDPCVWQDTDKDEQPDTINCPPGASTILVEDQDDDGDGIPDLLEGQSNQKSDSFDTLTMLILVIGVLLLFAFIIRMKKGNTQEEDKEYLE